MDREYKFNIPLTAERLTAYAVERQNGIERHQPPGTPSWMELRRFWTDTILQGMARLDGKTPDPNLMCWYDNGLNAARGWPAVAPLPVEEQTALIRDLGRYISILEADGNDRRQQITVTADLLGDMVTHRSWGLTENGLSQIREQAERSLLRMTARMPIRFTRIVLGGERGPCEQDFVSGAVTDAETVKATELYGRMSRQHPEVTAWPVLCTVYVGRGLNSATGTVDATGFDLSIMREAGDRFLKLPDIRPVGFRELNIVAPEHIQALMSEPDEPSQGEFYML